MHSRRRTSSLDNISEMSSEVPFNLHYPGPHPYQFTPRENRSEIPSYPNNVMMIPEQALREKKAKSRYRNSKYSEIDPSMYSEQGRSMSAQFTTLSPERLVEMAPQPPHRFQSDMAYQSRASAPLINYVHQKTDRYSGMYQQPSENHFSNSHIIHRGPGPGTPAFSSLSRNSSVRSASSTMSLPSTMYSFAAYGNTQEPSPISHRNSIRGAHEIPPLSPSLTRIPNSQRMSHLIPHAEMERVPTNPRGRNLR
ncbi:hypothetical protein K493DRAFT_47369 [Basidiobolus meristosporus CBS 931.73]|uniref:Uncharacterized protein n=1 Tax=Basidiobolus meristosporus CBS 931.73 TaxID=1314790 RepID=A0A1Y1Z3T6_9FUNG|nr:hypothetical protein K493DRAFT_47369 [Basidiobolus meristosporus CBS 931.73]|eukprot:ORY04930.1 hypothetical protein K493DRAFT_47369 [Basidiobolus meristosporus CBS 931.73]